MSELSASTEYGWWFGGSYSAGAQARTRKVRNGSACLSNTATNDFFSLPRIENALPGRDGYEVEIFGMEGIPAPDVADYKRRKEIELGLNPGTISQPQAKRPKIENRVYSQEELKIQLEAHIALMGAVDNPVAPPTDTATGAVVNAAPQAYVAPPTEISPPLPGITPTIPPFPSVGAQVPPIPGQAPFPPFPGPPGFSPGLDKFMLVICTLTKYLIF